MQKDNETEKYALKNLHYYVDNWEEYIHKDKPDLQNIRDNIGVEVCQNTTKTKEECKKIWNEISSLTYSEASLHPKINTHRFKGELFAIDNDKKAMSDTKGLVDFHTHIETASNIMLKKIKQKLPSYQFETMGLFVKLDYAFNTSDVKELFLLIDRQLMVGDKHFDFYILDCYDYGFLCYYQNTQTVIKKIIKND